MLRGPQLAVSVALLLGSGLSFAQAKSAVPAHDPWSPQHIDSLPAEIRNAIAPFARACGGRLAAEHSFATYFQRGAAKLTRPASVGARHGIVRILVVVHGEHGNEDIEMCRVLDAAASGICSGFSDWLTDGRLHFVGIGLRLDVVEIKIQ